MMGRRRASSAEIGGSRKWRREVQGKLRERQKSEGLEPVVKATLPNRLSQYESEEQEREAREYAVVEKVAVMRGKLPGLLRKLAEIPDPRQPKKIKHKLTCLLLYGILGFVLQVASRREANRELSRPVFRENLLLLFPDLEEIPHHDTLKRLLNRIDVEQIQEAQMEIVRSLMRKKKFQKYLIDGCYPIAIDGTQKFVTSTLWDAQYLERQVGDEKNKRAQYYIYVAEANLAFSNGMTIPLMTEFLDYERGDSGREKQDCELRAFYRLADRLRRAFPRLPIMLLLDGLYPCGPAMQVCIKNKWQFMIVLQDKSLPQVWEEYRGLVRLLEPNERWRTNWGSRCQEFHWVNEIEYDYEAGGRKRGVTVHLVVCRENWEEVDPKTGEVVTKTARHVWLSSSPLSGENVHERCNLGARYRWGIEAGILVEKRCGYHYEHCFAYSWSAMKGYHYLMRIAHLLNVLVQYSSQLAGMVAELGARGFIQFIRQTLSAPWLDRSRVSELLDRRRQLRLSLAT
jgi:hypothetical protein